MSLILYHYVHCPYCVRVRMALGFLKLAWQSRVVPYDDQETPIGLIGVKMLPILSIDGKPTRESLDIIRVLDKENKLQGKGDLTSAETFIKEINNPVHSLAMPYWIHTPEFNDSSREYFLKQKEAKRGPFQELVKNGPRFIAEMEPLLKKLQQNIRPYFESDHIRIQDIMIAAHLWGLYVVPEFQFPEGIHQYLQRVKNDCKFNYHQDYWS
jgi:glutaredoxin 2